MSTWTGFDACPQFEIGKCQAVELFGPAVDVDLCNKIRNKMGFYDVDSFLMMALVAEDGTYYDCQIVGWFTNAGAIVNAIRNEIWFEARLGHKCYFEVFNVVDDGDLWQAWEHDSAKACKDGGQPTDYHVYDGDKCVLDLVGYVPDMLYAVTVLDGADNIVTASWYSDADDWANAVNLATDTLDSMLSLEHQTALQLGLCVVDDWSMDEGLADAVTVLNAYYRQYFD